MFGRKRRQRDPDAEIHQPLTPERRERAQEHARMKLRAAKAQYIAGRIDLDRLWPIWWEADVVRRSALPFESSLRELVRDAMELERARLLTPHTVHTKRGAFATGGVVLPTGPTAPSVISPTPQSDRPSVIEVAVRGMTVDMYNGR